MPAPSIRPLIAGHSSPPLGRSPRLLLLTGRTKRLPKRAHTNVPLARSELFPALLAAADQVAAAASIALRCVAQRPHRLGLRRRLPLVGASPVAIVPALVAGN